MSYKEHFSRFLQSDPQRLHFAAHSHHPWPDASFAAHQQAWIDAAQMIDDKWQAVFGRVIPTAQRNVARVLGLADPATVVFAPNTHEFVVRLLSCLEWPARVLTTDGEFHSFRRQAARLEEHGALQVDRIALAPFDSFPARFVDAAGGGGHDLVFFSHVLYESGYVIEDLEAIVSAVPSDASLVVIDGYHSYMALPTNLARIQDRAFYLAGGYKYAMAGEGACFLHCPPGFCLRPWDTGWFAGMSSLETGAADVEYSPDGGRFWGATFDPSGLYRANAVHAWLVEHSISVGDIHAHVGRLQARFMEMVESGRAGSLTVDSLTPTWESRDRGHFLAFEVADAAAAYRQLHQAKVITDYRGNRLRIGFGLYHDDSDLDVLCERMAVVTAAAAGS